MRQENLSKALIESIKLHTKILNDEQIQDTTQKIVTEIKNCFDRGNKLLIAGNGGSAADAQHFAGEFVGHFSKDRKPLPVIPLHADTSTLTAIGNDYSFDKIFSRPLEALGQKGDIFIAYSTTGNSKNILNALEVAKEKEITTVSFLGKDGGLAKDLSDYAIIIPSDSTPRIQEAHTLFLHAITEAVEEDF
jgi:D-sedoheptulose 7-phosphate isomerase